MPSLLAGHPPWRQLLIVLIALPVTVVAAVLAFAWPAARIAPRELPVAVVGTGPATQRLITGLNAHEPGGFDFRLYADPGSAREAIRDRDVDGAFIVSTQSLSVLVASAASPTVSQMLTAAGSAALAASTQEVSSDGSAPTGDPAGALRLGDVVPLSHHDPRGAVFSSAILPITICGIFVAGAVGIGIRFRPAWRQLVALVSVSAVSGAGAFLIAQTWLGALPHEAAATWAALSLTVLAISSASAGLVALFGFAGFGLAAALMVFVGNPFGGATSAPEVLPDAVHHIGQWLPPGAGANLLRSTAYFDGHGAGGHLAVLVTWTVAGFIAIVVGHHAPIRFAANAESIEQRASWADGPGGETGAEPVNGLDALEPPVRMPADT